MPTRKIIRIDEDKCNGCGLCVSACAEGAIQLVDGKARLVSESYCDGLGACLGECPQDAITIEEREAEAFDEKAAQAHVQKQKAPAAAPASAPVPSLAHAPSHAGCAGTRMRSLQPKVAPAACCGDAEPSSALANWPVQLKLVPPTAPYFRGADLLLAADCVPFAYAGFHAKMLPGKPVIIGCPKLDDAGFYVEKLAAILKAAAPRSLTVAHMEVPCCMGLVHIAREAIAKAGVAVPLREITVSIDGKILSED
jgi:Pyruvate/2-oxoacid:ferredoxin oxidoreductase delta subunit